MLNLPIIYNTNKWKNFKCPAIELWSSELWYKRTLEYYIAIKNNIFLDYVGMLMIF